jgi:hypothetical protein
MQPTPHRCTRCSELVAEPKEITLTLDVLLFDERGRHENRCRKCVGFVLGRRKRLARLRLGRDRSRAAEYGSLVPVSVQPPVPELVSDGELSSRWPLSGLIRVHPDFAACREEQA